MIELTGKQRRYLRGLGHHLSPVVRVGQAGLTEALEAKTAAELENHELIKVKVGDGADDSPKSAAEHLAQACDAALVQVLGEQPSLYRPREKDPEIRLPK